MRITEPPFPPEAIECLPRVEVRYLAGLRVSGAIAWRRGKWRVIVNRSDTRGRRRFSLAHELKHLLDHPARHRLYADSHYGSAERAAEGAADYFAACLLMPKPWVKRGFYEEGFRDPAVLARQFEVSVSAMRWRFDQLGLREPGVTR
jgi:Zn-dependent peptidase ImmA (M78 family)